jgi:hypothetical protein
VSADTDSSPDGGVTKYYWFNSENNRLWTRKTSTMYHRINDHALSAAIYEPAKEVFPNILCGNYGTISCIDSSNPWNEYKNPWLTFPVTTAPRTRYLKADLSAPVLYSPEMGENRYDPSANGISHSFGSTTADIYKNWIVANTRACISGDNPTMCIPFIAPPDEPVFQGGTPRIHIPTEEDTLYILKEQYKLGVRSWSIFNSSHADSNNPNTALSRANKLLNVINQFMAWIETENTRRPRRIYKS